MTTPISSQSASGASVTFSGIPDTFSDLIFDFDGISHNGATPSQLRLEVSPDGVTFSTPFTFTPGYKADQTWRGWYEVLGYGADRGFAAGVAYYLSGTPGGVRPVADNTTGDYPVVLGMAKSTSVLSVHIVEAGVAI